jgi:hypothetical protein
MPDYQNGKIYKIYCNITAETYYGSTCNTLTKRVSSHKCDFKYWKNGKKNYIKSFDIIERGDYTYSLVEHFPCDSKIDLHSRERYWIENNNCVNKIIPRRTEKEYYEDNKEQICEQKKEYREVNKEKIREQRKEHYEANKERLLKKHREYGVVKVVCGCGSEITNNNLSRHRKSKKHIAGVES